MRIVYYFRNKGPGNYSIENVFGTLMNQLSSKVEIQQFVVKKPIDIRAIFLVRKLKADIHHITGAVNYLALGLPARNTILTVHDLGHYSETLSGWKKIIYKYLFWTFPLNRVQMVSVISEFTRDQLMIHFKLPKEKIAVIPNPVSELFKFCPRIKKDKPVVLQIGHGKNKNVESLILAVTGLDIKLLLIRPPDEGLTRMMVDQGLEFEYRDSLDNEMLVKAYQECDIVYFASTYEGFGLPIIEGMAVGRPVITSDLRPMKDVAGESAVLVNPTDVEGLRKAIISLTEDQRNYDFYQAKGLEHVKSYRPERISEMYLALYKRILE